MISKLPFLILLASPVFSQLAIRPDVTFDAGNDRFDLTSMIEETERMSHGQQRAQDFDDDGDESGRRTWRITDNSLVDKQNPGSSIISARRTDDFAYHDKMNSKEGGTVVEYEQNLKHFMNEENLKKLVGSRRMLDYMRYLHEGKSGRRSDFGYSDKEKDMMMHYAVPFKMDIDGYMKVPLS